MEANCDESCLVSERGRLQRGDGRWLKSAEMEYRQQLDVFIVGKGQICLGINVRRQFLKPPENAQIPSHKVKSVLDGRDKLVKSTIQKQRREIERSQTGFPTYSVRISNLPHNQMPRYCDRKQKCENSLLSGCDKRSVLCPNVDHFARKSRRKEGPIGLLLPAMG